MTEWPGISLFSHEVIKKHEHINFANTVVSFFLPFFSLFDDFAIAITTGYYNG